MASVHELYNKIKLNFNTDSRLEKMAYQALTNIISDADERSINSDKGYYI